MGRMLNELQPSFRSQVFEFLARLTEAKILVLIVDTGRTQEEQAEKIRLGVSWTPHSLHQDGLAIDIVPYAQYIEYGEKKMQWDENDPIWLAIGKIGTELGLKWGVVTNGKRKDLGHFEFQATRGNGLPGIKSA